MEHSYSRRRFLASSVAAGAGTSALSGCLGTGGGGTTTSIGLAFTVPIENLGSLFDVPEVREQLDNLGDEYELEVSRNSSTPDTLNQMASGEIDLGLLASVSYASAVRQEAVPGNISIVATDFWDAHSDYYGFTVYSDSDSEITDPEDLEGRKLGVNATGTGIHAVYAKKLEDIGLDPGSDVEFVELDFPAFPSAIKDGRIDAGIFPALFAVQAREEGFTEVFTSQSAWEEAYPFAYSCASQDSLDEKSDAFEAWGEDYVQLVEYVYDNRSEVVPAAASHFDLPEGLIDAFFLTEGDYFREEIRTDFERLQAVVDEMVALGFIEEGFDVEEYATNDYLPE